MRAKECVRSLVVGAILSVGLLLGPGSRPAAAAPAAGEPLWSVELAWSAAVAAPRVAPDGTVYVHSTDLYAITPGGDVLWVEPLAESKAVDVGGDGTIYAGSGGTILALAPSGQVLWTFTEPPGGQGLMAGPTVGPDGNIYAVTDGGGLGALALDPTGELLWNVPGFVNLAGTGLTPVELGPDRLYFAEDVVPSCTFSEGLVAIDLAGNIEWCVSFSDVARPASVAGNAVLHDSGMLYNFAPDGELAWSLPFPFPSGTLIGPRPGPDGALYIFHAYIDLWALTSDGSVRWVANGIAAGSFPIAPTVSPDGRTLVFGTVYGFGHNGSIFGVDTADGSVLWSLPVEGASAGAVGPAGFSPDGRVVYVPVGELSGANRLLAIAVETTLFADGFESGSTAAWDVAVAN